MRAIHPLLRSMLLHFVRAGESRLSARLRRLAYGTSCHVDTEVRITNPDHFRTGPRCALYHGTYVLNTFGRVTLGENSHLGAFCYVNAHHGNVSIGDDAAIGPGTKLFAYSNHYRAGSKVTDERITADVRIGNNVFIGANCSILPGSVVGDNIVVAAGTVVKGELLEPGVYAGAPARRVRDAWY